METKSLAVINENHPLILSFIDPSTEGRDGLPITASYENVHQSQTKPHLVQYPVWVTGL